MNTLQKLKNNGIEINLKDIKVIIEKNGIKEISVFGSALICTVDIVKSSSLVSPYKRKDILDLKEIIHAA